MNASNNVTQGAGCAVGSVARVPMGREQVARGSAYTAILTLAAAPTRVFRELADIENLPRWAGAFCERVELARGRWVALTALGELFLALDADESTGAITLWAGWTPDALHALPLRVVAADDDETERVAGRGEASPRVTSSRVTLIVPSVDGADHVRLCRALCEAWPGLAARCGGAVFVGGAGR